jgi:hypothetical protein
VVEEKKVRMQGLERQERLAGRKHKGNQQHFSVKARKRALIIWLFLPAFFLLMQMRTLFLGS